MMGIFQVVFRNALEQLHFHRQWRFARCEPRAVAQAEDMGIDGHGRLAESHIQDDVGRFSPDARKSFECRSIARHLPRMLIDQNLAGGHQMSGLAPIQADRPDVGLQSFNAQLLDFFGGIGDWKQTPGRLVDAHIGGLRTQQNCSEQFKHARILQFSVGLGVGCLQGGEKPLNVVSVHLPDFYP